MHLLGENDGYGVVQNALAEDQHVQDRVDLERIEDGQRGNRIDGRDERAEREALTRVQWINQVYSAEQIDTRSHDECADGCAKDGEDENGAYVLEKVSLQSTHNEIELD
jgi:hypothetical protein